MECNLLTWYGLQQYGLSVPPPTCTLQPLCCWCAHPDMDLGVALAQVGQGKDQCEHCCWLSGPLTKLFTRTVKHCCQVLAVSSSYFVMTAATVSVTEDTSIVFGTEHAS